jgi:hypothetical protein
MISDDELIKQALLKNTNQKAGETEPLAKVGAPVAVRPTLYVTTDVNGRRAVIQAQTIAKILGRETWLPKPLPRGLGIVFAVVLVIALIAVHCALLVVAVPAPIEVWLTRIGLLLQLLAGATVLPDYYGELKMTEWLKTLKGYSERLNNADPNRSLDRFTTYVTGAEKRALTIAWLLWLSIGFIYVFYLKWPIPWTVVISYFTTVIAVVTATADGLVRIAYGIVTYAVRQQSMRQVLARVTLPLFGVGAIVQLIATFVVPNR